MGLHSATLGRRATRGDDWECIVGSVQREFEFREHEGAFLLTHVCCRSLFRVRTYDMSQEKLGVAARAAMEPSDNCT